MDVVIERRQMLELLKYLSEADPIGATKSELERKLNFESLEQCELALRFGLVCSERFGESSDSVKATPAGRQYLDSGGAFDLADLSILPTRLEDLIARKALRESGRKVIEELGQCLVDQSLPERFIWQAPLLFDQKIGQPASVALYAAANSLLVRLLHDEPPGSLAEAVVGAVITETAKALFLEPEWGAEFGEDERAEALFEVRGAIVNLRPLDLADRFVVGAAPVEPPKLLAALSGVPSIGYLDR